MIYETETESNSQISSKLVKYTIYHSLLKRIVFWRIQSSENFLVNYEGIEWWSLIFGIKQ